MLRTHAVIQCAHLGLWCRKQGHITFSVNTDWSSETTRNNTQTSLVGCDNSFPSSLDSFQTTRSHPVNIAHLRRSICSPLRQTIRLQIWNVGLFAASFWSIGPKTVLYQSVCRLPGGNFPGATNPPINSFLIISEITPITLDPCGRMSSNQSMASLSVWTALIYLSIFRRQVKRGPEDVVSSIRISPFLQQQRHHLSVPTGTGYV